MILKCDFKDCKEEVVSGGNTIYDENGDDFQVDLCKKHLDELIGEQKEEQNDKRR